MSTVTIGEMKAIILHIFLKYWSKLEIEECDPISFVQAFTGQQGNDIQLYLFDKLILEIEDSINFRILFNSFVKKESYRIDYDDMLRFILDGFYNSNTDAKIYIEYLSDDSGSDE